MALIVATFLMAFTYTFHSRAKVSGSLRYHAAVGGASNAAYASMLSLALPAASAGAWFVAAYAASATAGGVSAHWLCLRLERGRARMAQEDRVTALERRIQEIERCQGKTSHQQE